MIMCGASKTNRFDCSCLCTLECGHDGRHKCECHQNWTNQELLMKSTSNLNEVLPLFRKHFEHITEFRHMCENDKEQLISDLQNDSRLITEALTDLKYAEMKCSEKQKLTEVKN